MSIEKSLYAAPEGLAALENQEPDIEIEIEDPEAVKIEMDGLEIEMRQGDGEGDFNENLAEVIDEGTIQSFTGLS